MNCRANRSGNTQNQTPEGECGICLAETVVEGDQDSGGEEPSEHEKEIAEQSPFQNNEGDGIQEAANSHDESAHTGKSFEG